MKDDIISATLRNRNDRLIENIEKNNVLLRSLDTSKSRMRRDQDRRERARIEALLVQEYGPAIESVNPWWECDCP